MGHVSLGIWELGLLGRTSVEERVAREDDLVVAVLHEPADAVLGVAGCVEGLDGDAADVEGGPVGWGLGDALALAAADDGEVVEAEVG